MKKFCYLSLVLSTFSLVSCLSTGRDFPSRTDWIRKDVTQQKDVRLVLGEPFAVGDSGGVNTWTYGYYRYEFPGKSFHKELKLYWNLDQTVKNYTFNSSFPLDVQRGRLEGMAQQQDQKK